MSSAKRLLAGLLVLSGCEGAEVKESLVEHRYTVDVSAYAAPNEPAGLFLANQNLALPLEAKDLTLTEANPGSLETVYSRSFCEVGQLPTDLPGWDNAMFLEVSPVRLKAVSITIAFNGNDLIRKPTFAVRDAAGHWSACSAATQVASNATTLTATLATDHPDATLVAIFPDTYTSVHNLRYTTQESSPE